METEAQLQTVVEYSARKNEKNSRQWGLTVRVHFKSANERPIPYAGTVEALGELEVSAEWPEAEIEKLVVVNGTGMLYSSIREMILSVTSRGPYSPLMLPTQSFLATYQEQQRKAGKRAVAPEPTKS